jgi:hypothetical protein
MFVTSQGSAYSQFKRALERRNFLLAWTMAAELPRVPLADALSLLCSRVISNRGGSRRPRRVGAPGYAPRPD